MSRSHQHGKRRDRRYQKNRVPGTVIPAEGVDARDDQRSEDRADLVQRFVQREPPSTAHFRRRVRQHRVTGRHPYRLSHALGDHQDGREFPTARQREERYREQVDRVSQQGDRPVPARPIADDAGDQAQDVSDQFARTGHKAHHGAAGSQQGQEGPVDASRPLVGHVGQKADDADQDDEAERGALADRSTVPAQPRALGRGPDIRLYLHGETPFSQPGPVRSDASTRHGPFVPVSTVIPSPPGSTLFAGTARPREFRKSLRVPAESAGAGCICRSGRSGRRCRSRSGPSPWPP